jgi:hypothetical protein
VAAALANPAGFGGGSRPLRDFEHGSTEAVSLGVRERAVHLVRERQGEYPTQWATITFIAGKIGCSSETLRC